MEAGNECLLEVIEKLCLLGMVHKKEHRWSDGWLETEVQDPINVCSFDLRQSEACLRS